MQVDLWEWNFNTSFIESHSTNCPLISGSGSASTSIEKINTEIGKITLQKYLFNVIEKTNRAD